MGVKGDTSKHICILNVRNCTVKMCTGFVMNGKHVSTGILKSMNIAVRLFDHQVSIERFLRKAADCLDHGDAERDIRNKHTVHNVEMDPLGLRTVKHIDILIKGCKISGKEGRGDNRFRNHLNRVKIRVAKIG